MGSPPKEVLYIVLQTLLEDRKDILPAVNIRESRVDSVMPLSMPNHVPVLGAIQTVRLIFPLELEC